MEHPVRLPGFDYERGSGRWKRREQSHAAPLPTQKQAILSDVARETILAAAPEIVLKARMDGLASLEGEEVHSPAYRRLAAEFRDAVARGIESGLVHRPPPPPPVEG